MTQWLRGRTVFQRIALGLLLLTIGEIVVSLFTRASFSSDFFVLALLLCFFAFRKEILWRVRNRLLITYLLFGVIPLLLIGFLLSLTAELLLGQFATQRVRQALDARIETVRAAAEDLALAASKEAPADLLEAIRGKVPRLEAVVTVDGKITALPPNGDFRSIPPWIAPGFGDLLESDGHYFLGASVQEGNAGIFAYEPLDERTLASLTPGVVDVVTVLRSGVPTDFVFGPEGSNIIVVENGVRRQLTATALPGARGWWDIPISGMLSLSAHTASGSNDILMPLVSRPSLLAAGVVTGRMASVVLALLIAIASLFLIVEGISLISSLSLTRTITRSVDDLYQGTMHVAEGNFSHQIPVRGQHQLSDLAASFNSMTTRIQGLIGEVKKKEKLDAELEIARQVQLRLFPRSVPKLRSLEIAGVCIPGRVVSGDYYDYVSLDDRRTVIVLGDVSGKGVSAALLMASLQSALHAQLKFSGHRSHAESAGSGEVSTARLMEVIGQQLYENTPPEKYATFFCSVYDDETGLLTYTNAGHLAPILVREGKSGTLAGGGVVAGLLPNVKYDQHEVQLLRGDLLAIFSDGVLEAEDSAEQQFGEDRLAGLLASNHDRPLVSTIDMITRAVEKWIHDPDGRDDLTLVLMRKL